MLRYTQEMTTTITSLLVVPLSSLSDVMLTIGFRARAWLHLADWFKLAAGQGCRCMYRSAHMHTALTPVPYRCTLFATRRVEALLFRRSVGTAAVVGQPCSPASALAPAYRWHSVRRSFCDNQKRIVLRNSSDRDAGRSLSSEHPTR